MSSKIVIKRFMMLFMAILLLAAAPAYAGYGGSATPDFPPVVQLGDTGVSVGLTLVPTANGDDSADVALENITMIPQCGARTGSGTCSLPDVGVFSVSAAGTGAAGTACEGVNFTISLQDATTGEVLFIPSEPLVLTPTNLEIPQIGDICRINFTVDIDNPPTIDSNIPLEGVQTAQEGRFFMLLDEASVGAGQGSDETTVLFCGDGIVNNDEDCDDGNDVPYDGCGIPGDNCAICLDSEACDDTDGNICTTAGCEAGFCIQEHIFNDSLVCDDIDGESCTHAGCEQGECVQTHVLEAPSTPCADIDGNECTTAGCSVVGACDQNHIFNDSLVCDDTDGESCSHAGCEQGACVQTHTVEPPSTPCADTDGESCSHAGCNEVGVCDQNHAIEPPSTPCEDIDGNVCTTAGCSVVGACDQNHIYNDSLVCDDTDGESCTHAGCEQGACVQNHTLEPPSTPCADTDGNDCTTAGCNEVGACDQAHIELPCGVATCRTPGFWGTHAGTEKGNSNNITQMVINAGGGSLDVCGECINATVPVNNAASAVEAICVSPSGDIVLQNARQLTALALNCVVSGFGADCANDPSLAELFSDCNNACLDAASTRTNEECRNEIDCFNNGGLFLDDSNCDETGHGTGCNEPLCQDSVCSYDSYCCTNNWDGICVSEAQADAACVLGTDICVDQRPEDNCHERVLGVCEDGSICTADNTTDGLCDSDGSQCKPGPAGSSKACNSATSNDCTVIGSGEAECATDSCP